MKKNLLIVALLLISTVTPGFSFWPFSDLKISNEIKNLKDSVEKNFSDNKTGVNDVKAGLNDIASDAIKMNADVSAIKDGVFTMNNRLEASLAANASIGQTLSTLTAGRDALSNSGNTNDTSLMKSVISAMSAIILALIGYIKLLSNQKAKLDGQLMTMQQARDDDYDELVDFQSKMFEDVLKSKETYKQMYLDSLKKGA